MVVSEVMVVSMVMLMSVVSVSVVSVVLSGGATGGRCWSV